MPSRLFTRLALSITLLLTISLLTLGFLLLENAQNKFLDERLGQVKAQTKTLAIGSLDGLISKDYELLENWLKSVMPADFYAYAFLSSADGKVLAHTDLSQVGHEIKARPIDGFLIKENEYKGRPIKEVIFPAKINNKLLANAHLAYYLDDVSFYNDEAAFYIILVLVLFLLIMLGAVLIIVKHFVAPLTDLTHVITATSLGAARNDNLGPELLDRDDEIGALAKEFQYMIVRLKSSYELLQNEEARLRDTVNKKTFELQQTNKELEAFSYSVSHDLRAPLRVIDGFSQVLFEDYGESLDSTAREYIKRVRSATQRMRALIDSLLELSRIKHSELKKTKVNLSLLVENAFQALKENQPDRMIDVSIEKNITVRGDRNMLSAMIENLMSNAWKYTAKKEHPSIIFSSMENEKGKVYFIKDNGAGFDEDFARDKLFKTFQRLHSESDFEGTGIGLATVQRIINLHQGQIWAEAEEGEGACFYFTLPE